jgi:hypothetical protein
MHRSALNTVKDAGFLRSFLQWVEMIPTKGSVVSQRACFYETSEAVRRIS